jgi:hypothetical protein
MAKNQKRWVYRPKKMSSPKIPESLKSDVGTKADELIESYLKPTFIKPPPQDDRFNYLVDISSKWYRNYFYFCCRYCCPGPNAISPHFDDKFARLEYVGKDNYNLSYMRHTGKWQAVYDDLTLEECLKAIRDEALFQP